ncbi:MAG: YbjQ family protein [Clostridiales bacterium]|nr:YbjQ family protein [Clostridiales bacterium]
MLKLTIYDVPGREIQAIGLVKGNVVQAKNIGRDLMAGLKGMAGGEIKSYTEMMTEARQIATARMEKEAEALGADAIIGLNFTSSSVMDGTAEIIAYGTAVKFL